MATNKVSALGRATRKDASSAKKIDPDIIPAADLSDFNGDILYTKDEIVQAFSKYAEGKALEDQGKALQKMNRIQIESFGVINFARRWVAEKSIPENPKLCSSSDGSGTVISMSVQDKEVNISDEEFIQLANIIGAVETDANTIKRDEITFNQDTLYATIKVGKDEKTVVELIDEAISEKFEKLGRADVLDGLFQVKTVSRTKKGLLQKGLALVGGAGPDAARKLVDFMEAANAVISLKVGANTAKK